MLRFLVIQKQPPCYNALKLLICSTVFPNAVALQSEPKEGFSTVFYTLILQNAEVQASPPSPARGAAPWAWLGSAVCLEVHRCCSLPGCSSSLVFWWVFVFWFFGFFFNFGARPYLNLLQLYACAIGRLGSLREEPDESLEQHSPPPLFSEELQCKTQSCYTLVEPEVGRNCLSSGHGMDSKSLTCPYSHSIWHWFVMGTVSEEMILSAVSYAQIRSCQNAGQVMAGLF